MNYTHTKVSLYKEDESSEMKFIPITECTGTTTFRIENMIRLKD